MKLTSIKTLQDVKSFVHILMEEENLTFHPDTPFEDYIVIQTNEPAYSKEEVELRSSLLNQAFDLGERLDADTHELMCGEGFSVFQSSLS
jgi:hypothetical protein